MGLLKKKDRQDGPPPPEEGSVLDLLPSMASESSPTEGDMAKHAERPDPGSASPEKAYTNELRLAVEAVASGTGQSTAESSDKYGLLAELEAQRRRAEMAGEDTVVDDRDPEPATAEVAAEASVSVPDDEPAARVEPVAAREHLAPDTEPALRPVAIVSEPPPSEEPVGTPGRSATEARARLEAFERSILEKTDAMRQRAAELAQREQELVAKVDGLDALEAETAERHAALEQRERELQAKLTELQAEAERLEEEQAIWGEATRESKTRIAELEESLAARETALDKAENRHEERLAGLQAEAAELAAREEKLVSAMSEFAAEQEALAEAQSEFDRQRQELDETTASLAQRDQEFAAREGDLRAGEDALALRERELDRSSARLAEIEATVAERERDFGRREAEIEARETAIAVEQERLEQERGEWDEVMRGAFSRLSELESDLVSSLSVAGMLKRELEGRDAPAPKERRGSARMSEQDEARAFYRADVEQASTEWARPVEVDGLKESVAEANGVDAQANATDWWARQLGRRKKD